jgi:dienelactone hydrolase
MTRTLAVGITWAVLGCCLVAQDSSDPLPRRGFLGVGLEQAGDGVRVFTVSPESTAAAVGISIGDVIVQLDGQPVTTPEFLIAAMGRRRGGDSIRLTIARNGERRTVEAALRPFPPERMANATVHYASVELRSGVRLRTIVSVPTTAVIERVPAVLLIQGGGCGSIDTPIGPPIAQPGLMHAIGSRGFVTMRVEKSGVGDSQGEPCAEIGFQEELAGYRAALAALRSHPAVDPVRVYVLGISLGGVFAPLLGAETPVAGIVVYGTLAGPPPPYPGRSERFFREFASVDVQAAWEKVGTRVLVLHGEYDVGPEVNRSAHEQVAAFVNRATPGAAEFRELPGLDHCWSRHPSLDASRDRCGQGQQTPDLAEAILAFLRPPTRAALPGRG